MMRKLCRHGKDWDIWLVYALFAFRETPHTATGFTPFELFFGREVRGPTAVLKEQWTLGEKLPQSVVTFVLETQDKLAKMLQQAKETEKQSKVKMKTYNDKHA